MASLTCATFSFALQPAVIATTYVGPHFEVRHPDQAIKYVFNGTTRVASVIGSLSPANRVQKIRLVPGWNLCSLAVSGVLAMGDGQVPGDLSLSVFIWDAFAQGWTEGGLNQGLPANTVLWIRAGTNTTLCVTGPYADPEDRPLQDGGNYVAGAGLESWALLFPPGLFAWTFNASNAGWQEHLTDGLASSSEVPPLLGPGQALYARSASPTSLQRPDPALRVRYYHQDHLGSSSAVTDANGMLLQEVAYHPFGLVRHEFSTYGLSDPYEFTQKERDKESGLHYFQARYLAGALSRFITPDIKYANPDTLAALDEFSLLAAPQVLNLYAYVQNNPLRYTDPSGLDKSKKTASAKPKQAAPTVTIATPLAGRQFVRQKNGSVVVTLANDVQVTILPDRYNGPANQDNVTGSSITEKITGDAKKGFKITYHITLRTTFTRGTNPDDDSAFGRGTTKPDEDSGHKSVRFHEGQHGARILDFLETHPLPQIEAPSDGNSWSDMNDKRKEAMDKYNDALEDFHVQETDCVGHKNLNATRACH